MHKITLIYGKFYLCKTKDCKISSSLYKIVKVAGPLLLTLVECGKHQGVDQMITVYWPPVCNFC